MSTAGEDIVEKIIEAFSNRWIKLILFVIALAYTLPAWLFIVNGNWANYKDINQELVPSDTLHYYYNKELNLRVSFGKSFACFADSNGNLLHLTKYVYARPMLFDGLYYNGRLSFIASPFKFRYDKDVSLFSEIGFDKLVMCDGELYSGEDIWINYHIIKGLVQDGVIEPGEYCTDNEAYQLKGAEILEAIESFNLVKIYDNGNIQGSLLKIYHNGDIQLGEVRFKKMENIDPDEWNADWWPLFENLHFFSTEIKKWYRREKSRSNYAEDPGYR